MPTYDYVCEACGHEFEEYQSITAKSLTKCPKCRKKSLRRLIGAGAGVIFKGSGFYQTDYRSEGYKKSAEAESKSSSESASKDKDAKKPESGAVTSKSEPAKTESGKSEPAKSEPSKTESPKSRRGKSDGKSGKEKNS